MTLVISATAHPLVVETRKRGNRTWIKARVVERCGTFAFSTSDGMEVRVRAWKGSGHASH